MTEPQKEPDLEKKVMIIGWLILILTLWRFYFLGLFYTNEANRHDEGHKVQSTPEPLYQIEGLIVGNLLSFLMSFLLLYAAYKKRIVCFLIWLIVTTLTTAGEIAIHICLIVQAHMQYIYFLLIWDVMMCVMIAIVFAAYWKFRHHQLYTVQP